MVGSIEVASKYSCSYSNGVVQNSNGSEEKLDELRRYLGKGDGDVVKIVGVGAGAWGSVFAALLQDSYGQYRDKVQIRIWRRAGRAVDRATAEHLFEVINSREDVLRRLIRRCAYLKYVEARLGDRTLYADEILKDGFCLNMIDTPLCPMKVVTNLQEAVWDADVVINGLPSTETREVFEEIRNYWKERITAPIIISLAKGIEAELNPSPRIITPTQMINQASKHSFLPFPIRLPFGVKCECDVPNLCGSWSPNREHSVPRWTKHCLGDLQQGICKRPYMWIREMAIGSCKVLEATTLHRVGQQ